MITKRVMVKILVSVTVDDEKFTPEFMDEFREYLYPFDTLDDHICHLGQMEAHGLLGFGDTFIEGYGPMSRMGISTQQIEQEQEIEDC